MMKAAQMSAAGGTTRNSAAEHLRLLRALAQELERAVDAIVENRLSDLEDSIARQEILSLHIHEVISETKTEATGEPDSTWKSVDADLRRQIQIAAGEVRKLNLCYSMLLQHANRSVGMIISLFRSVCGELQEGGGARRQHATWSCHG